MITTGHGGESTLRVPPSRLSTPKDSDFVSRDESTGRPLDAAVRVRVRQLKELASTSISAWCELEERSLSSNAYLSPNFVIPACRYLHPSPDSVFVITMEKAKVGTPDLLGVGVFEHRAPTRRFPLTHMGSFSSRHSFLSGLLVDREFAEPAVSAFFDYCCSAKESCHGVNFQLLPGDGPLFPLLQKVAAQYRAPWFEYERQERAVLDIADSGEAYLTANLPNARRSDLRRCMRRLQELGEVSWRVMVGKEITDTQLESFLDLEHCGWKGEKGTSLRARGSDAAFFLEMFTAFREQERAVLMQLCLNGQPIAATTNFCSGNAGFAFKLGWDTDHAKVSPGLLNEVELIRNAPVVFGKRTYLDGGGEPGSFIEKLWVKRRPIVAGSFATSALGKTAFATAHWAARAKRLFAYSK